MEHSNTLSMHVSRVLGHIRSRGLKHIQRDDVVSVVNEAYVRALNTWDKTRKASFWTHLTTCVNSTASDFMGRESRYAMHHFRLDNAEDVPADELPVDVQVGLFFELPKFDPVSTLLIKSLAGEDINGALSAAARSVERFSNSNPNFNQPLFEALGASVGMSARSMRWKFDIIRKTVTDMI